MADEDNQIKMDEDAQAEPHPSDAKAPLKFSFSVVKSSASSRPPLFPKADRHRKADETKVEFVSEFDGKGRSPAQGPVKVIPLPDKSWRPEKRMKNIMVASENLPSTEERFESETLSAGPRPDVQYGLQLKRKPSDSGEEAQNVTEVATESVQDRDLQRYREDIALLPDEMSVHEYENVPVEEFGEALLRGMGWEKGKPIGRNATAVTPPIEPVKKFGRGGLGAIPAPQPEKEKKYIKPGETRKRKLTVGRVMCVIAGIHAGFRGQIAEVSGSSYTVALLESGMRVRVKEAELAEVGSSEEEKAMKKLSALHIDGHTEESIAEERKRNHINDGETKRDERSSGEDLEVFVRESRDERSKSGHRKDDRARSKGREENHADNGDDSRHRSRKDYADNNHGRERGDRDALDNRHAEHKNRRGEDRGLNDGRECYEATASRQGQYGQGDESHRHETRDGNKSMFDSKYERKEKDSRRADSRGDSSKSYHRKKGTSSKQEERKRSGSAKGGSIEEPTVDTVGHSSTRMHSWLAPDIRVRIIDRRAYGEKLYLQKACVVDVVSPSLCDIQMDEGGKIIQKVKQEHLETALPRRGGRVLVVGGKHRGQVGKLQERDSSKGVGLVQIEENYEVLSIDLDDLAEFVGTLHEMEQ